LTVQETDINKEDGVYGQGLMESDGIEFALCVPTRTQITGTSGDIKAMKPLPKRFHAGRESVFPFDRGTTHARGERTVLRTIGTDTVVSNEELHMLECYAEIGHKRPKELRINGYEIRCEYRKE
jgi:hypothetical protein